MSEALGEAQDLKQQEVMYNVDFQLAMVERRLWRAAGARTQDETAALTARIAQLEAALAAAAQEHGLLSAAVAAVNLHLGVP